MLAALNETAHEGGVGQDSLQMINSTIVRAGRRSASTPSGLGWNCDAW